MKDFFISLAKGIVGFLFSLIAPVILVIIGALMVGYGISIEMEWVIYAGVFLAALGLLLIFRYWLIDD